MTQVNNYFAELTVTQPEFLGRLWSCVDEAVNLKRCDVFCYSPDPADESLYVNVWAFHFFFYSKDRNLLVYFTTAATSKLRKNELDYISEDEDEYMQYGSDDEPEMQSDDTDSPKPSQVDSAGDDEDMPEWDGII